MANLPVKAPGRFRRIDMEGDEWERSMATLEALAYGYTHITNALLQEKIYLHLPFIGGKDEGCQDQQPELRVTGKNLLHLTHLPASNS